MSMELEAVIERCVSLLTEGPPHTREEIAALLNRWEATGLISRQMRAVIVQRLRASQAGKHPALRDLDSAE
jgi:hypothetical protein